MKDAKTIMDKKKYVAFWLERYAKKEPGMPLTVVFDMAESGLSNIVSAQFISLNLNSICVCCIKGICLILLSRSVDNIY